MGFTYCSFLPGCLPWWGFWDGFHSLLVLAMIPRGSEVLSPASPLTPAAKPGPLHSQDQHQDLSEGIPAVTILCHSLSFKRPLSCQSPVSWPWGAWGIPVLHTRGEAQLLCEGGGIWIAWKTAGGWNGSTGAPPPLSPQRSAQATLCSVPQLCVRALWDVHQAAVRLNWNTSKSL